MSTSVMNEPTSIGLSDNAHAVLKRLKEDGHFAEMVDAYRFGIALALAHGVAPEEPTQSRTTIFSVATVDPDREIEAAVRLILGNKDIPIYRMCERLAEWGVSELGRRAETGTLDVGTMLLPDGGSEIKK